MKLQILHIENSSLWIIIWILMAFFCTPSKSSPIDFLSLAIVSGLCVSAASPHWWRFSHLGRETAPTGQLRGCEKPSPGISPSFLSGSAFELRSRPWSLPELCYRDAVPHCLDSDLLTWLPVLTSGLLLHQGWCGRHRSLGHLGHYPSPTSLSTFGCGGPASLSEGCCLCRPCGAWSWFTFPCRAACPCCFLTRV